MLLREEISIKAAPRFTTRKIVTALIYARRGRSKAVDRAAEFLSRANKTDNLDGEGGKGWFMYLANERRRGRGGEDEEGTPLRAHFRFLCPGNSGSRVVFIFMFFSAFKIAFRSRLDCDSIEFR